MSERSPLLSSAGLSEQAYVSVEVLVKRPFVSSSGRIGHHVRAGTNRTTVVGLAGHRQLVVICSSAAVR